MIKIFLCLAFLLNFVYPCAVCYGAPDDPVTLGINKAILFLLFIIVFVLSCIVYWIVSLARKSNKINV